MSRRETSDYKKVNVLFTLHYYFYACQYKLLLIIVLYLMQVLLKAVTKLVPIEIAVKKFVTDFESAMWSSGIQAEFPMMTIQGCLFHLTQAVFRHIYNS